MVGRMPLSAERIVEAAAIVADQGGIQAVSMRSVGRELDVEAMSLYHHIASKDTLLDALTDWVFAQMQPPKQGLPWRESVRDHAASARSVLTAHPWSLTLVETRSSPGPAVLRRHDALIGCFRGAGFPVQLTSHATSVLDAYIYGFALTERNLPFDPGTGANEFATTVNVPWGDYPHLAELVGDLTRDGDYSFSAEFDIGLDLILDSLERGLAESL